MVRATGRIPDRRRCYLLTPEDLHLHWLSLPFWNCDAAAGDHHSCPRPSHRRSIQDAVAIILTGLPLPAFACYRSGRQFPHAWKKPDSPIVDPNCYGGNGDGDDRFMRLCSGIWLRGKFYALSLQGTLVVIEPEAGSGTSSGDFKVGSVGKQRAVPGVSCKHFREILVESEGEILLVFLVSRKSVRFVDGVEVYRLDIGKLEWVRRDDLGDRVLLFGSNCCSVSVGEAGELGCRRNCVYFKHPCSAVAGWSQYDMAIGTINHLS